VLQVVAAAAMLSLSRALGRRLFSSAAAASEGGAAASTSVVRKAQNPLEEFFEVERSAADDQARPHYGTSSLSLRLPYSLVCLGCASRIFNELLVVSADGCVSVVSVPVCCSLRNS
jgi:hypothetical protein